MDQSCEARFANQTVDGAREHGGHAKRTPSDCCLLSTGLIVQLKREYPSWGAPKIRERLKQRTGVEELEYPFHDWTAVITHCGRICFQRRKINVSQVFGGQKVGVKQVADHIWLVTFMDYDLGYFDDETCRLEPIDNPFGPKLLPMSPE